MTNVQADIQVDAGNNAWLLTLPEVRIEGELFEECTVVALRTLKDSWYHPDGENYSGPRTLAGRECQISLFWNGGGWGKEQTRCWLMGNAAAYLLGKNSAGRDSSQEYMDFP